MGPLIFISGIADDERLRKTPDLPASMGPLIFISGIRFQKGKTRVLLIQLQWGR